MEHLKFKHLSPMLTIDEVVAQMTSLIPHGRWSQPNGQDIHLVITGGEPLLGWQRAYIQLLEHPDMRDLKHVTFETNGTQSLHEDFKEYLGQQTRLHFTWSCSPKLTASGEEWSQAIRPEIVETYVRSCRAGTSDLYLKFVVADSSDVDDVGRAVGQYMAAGVDCPVYLMPVGGTPSSYHYNTKQVAILAMEHGWRYSPRLQVDIFKNDWGT